jgi:hypothetical protein
MPKSSRHMREQKRDRAGDTTTVATWLRGIGAGSILLGGFGVISLYFWAGVICVFFGFAVLTVDLWLERISLRAKQIGFVCLLMLAIAFGWGVAFVPAPLYMAAVRFDAEYPDGTVLS